MYQRNALAEVALKTKQPGDIRDYRVLAWSRGGLDKDDFERLFVQLGVGTLPSTSGSPVEQPPWITIGTYTKGGTTYLAVIEQHRTNMVDARNRQVSALPCLAIPYEHAVRSHVDFSSIYRELQRIAPDSNAAIVNIESSASGDPDAMRVTDHVGDRAGATSEDGVRLAQASLAFGSPESRQQQLARLIDEKLGFRFAAVITALMLARPVALLLSGNLSSPQDRLDYLDAFASLLPYGARCGFSASTWMQSSNPETNMRIGFSDAARREQFRIEWHPMPDAPFMESSQLQQQYQALLTLFNGESEALARRYFEVLLTLHRHAGTLGVVQALAEQTTPVTFNEPLRMLEMLEQLALPMEAYEAVRNNNGNPEKVRKVFASGRDVVWSEQQQREMIGFLLANVERVNLTIQEDKLWLNNKWESLQLAAGVRERSRSTLQQLATLPAADPQRQTLSSHLLSLCHVSALAGSSELARLLTTLIDQARLLPGANEERGSFAYKEVARLLATYAVKAWLSDADNNLVWDRVSTNRPSRLLAEVGLWIKAQASSPKEISSWFDWLENRFPTVQDTWLIFRIAAGLSVQGDLALITESVKAVESKYGAEYVEALFRQAVEAKTLGNLATILTAWLLQRSGQFTHRLSGLMAAHEFAKLRPITVQLRAWLDVVYLLLEASEGPRFLHEILTGTPEACAEYALNVRGGLNMLRKEVERTKVSRRMEHELQRESDNARSTRNRERTLANISTLASALQLRIRISATSQENTQRADANRTGSEPAQRSEQAPPLLALNASPAEAALVCVNLTSRAGLTEEILQQLGSTRYFDGYRKIEAVLYYMRLALAERNMGANYIQQIRRDFFMAALNGYFDVDSQSRVQNDCWQSLNAELDFIISVIGRGFPADRREQIHRAIDDGAGTTDEKPNMIGKLLTWRPGK